MKEATQHKLLEATLKLISEKGYIGATTREIAQEAGVTELTLFRHFGSKEKLFEEVLSTYTFLPTLKELLPELVKMSCEEALALVATEFLLTMKKRKPMIKIMHSEMTLYPEKIREVYTRAIEDIRSSLAQYFETLQKKGTFRNVSPETAARVFLSIVFSYFRNEEIMRGQEITKAKMEKNVREFVDIFLHGTISSNHS
jgi:AcrR family transcriptional regulator